MKKMLALFSAFVLIFTLSACTREVELPDLTGLPENLAREELQDKGLNVNVFESSETRSTREFLDYQNHEVGDIVEEGDLVTIVVSSTLEERDEVEQADRTPLDPDGAFNEPYDVALYLDTFDELPDNYITLEEAKDAGYDPDEENLWDVTDDKNIGGDPFDASDIDALPDENGRSYYTADVNVEDGIRGEERLVYSDDGLVYHTEDGYETFEQIFGNEEHPPLDPDGEYIRHEEVALYLRTFGELPPNHYDRPDYQDEQGYTFRDLRDEFGERALFGYWNFSNWGNQLPGHVHDWQMADVNIGEGGRTRGVHRLVFSQQERIVYYTDDHYDTFEMLFGDGRN